MMNKFSEQFDNRIKAFWESEGIGRPELLKDILEYANANPQTFKNDIAEIRFDKEIVPLPIVLEALSKDTENWGQFFVDLLDDIFQEAKRADKPKEILMSLMEFAYIENDEKPFVQKIANRFYEELGGYHLETKLAAIWELPYYLNNPAVGNRDVIMNAMHRLLTDRNWRVRVATYQSLGYENLLPVGYQLSFTDKLLKLISGVWEFIRPA